MEELKIDNEYRIIRKKYMDGEPEFLTPDGLFSNDISKSYCFQNHNDAVCVYGIIHHYYDYMEYMYFIDISSHINPEQVFGRKENGKMKIELTDIEIALLKVLYYVGFRYIVREKTDYLWALNKKPISLKEKLTPDFYGEELLLREFKNCFRFIKKEDEEPYKIEELLNEKVDN